jgi:hypothetical protein
MKLLQTVVGRRGLRTIGQRIVVLFNRLGLQA